MTDSHICTCSAGKSTLSSLLLRRSMNKKYEDSNDAIIADGSLEVTQQQTSTNYKGGGIGWVSTELHLHATHSWRDKTVLEILSLGASTLFDHDRRGAEDFSLHHSLIDIEASTTALQWLGLISTTDSQSFLTRKFSTLSQGQQKLLLISSAIAQRPSLLILDEPCQGLDLWNRARVLNLIEDMCQFTDAGLVYITHHDQELITSIKKRIRLEDGRVVYCGDRC